MFVICFSELVELFQVLGESGVDFNSNLDLDGCSALITAATLDWPEVVQILITFGADVNDQGMPKFGAFVSTDLSMQGYGDQVNQTVGDKDRFIFSKGCGQSVSPLLCAIMLKRQVITDILLSAGADCQQMSVGSFWRSSRIGACSVCDVSVNAIHLAAYKGEDRLLQKLLDVCQKKSLETHRDTKKPFVSCLSSEYELTPLWLALLRGETDAVKTLLAYDHPRAPPCLFGSGLYIAVEEGHFELAKILMLSGYNINEDMEWIESESYPTGNKDMKDFIRNFCCEPQALLIICRDVLRCHMGPRLSSYLKMINVPQKIQDLLLLKEILSCEELNSSK